jgi:hypothetical protein
MHRAPISSERPVKGEYPQTPPHTAEFVDQGATFMQHRRMLPQVGGGTATREMMVVRVVEVTATVLKSGEVVIRVVVGAGATST